MSISKNKIKTISYEADLSEILPNHFVSGCEQLKLPVWRLHNILMDS